MKEAKLGGTNTSVSAICLGTMYFGTKQNQQDSFKLLDLYFEKGGRFLDTANCYAWWVENGTGNDSEKVLGEWLNGKENREEIILATKVGARLVNYSEGKNWTKCLQGLQKDTIFQAVEESLKRLKTDYIDLYYAHIDDRSTPLEETLEAFDELKSSGKIKHIGCSNYHTWRLERAIKTSKENNWVEYCCIQQGHTYLRPKFGATLADDVGVITSIELLDYCQNNSNISLIAYSPLIQGSYTREDRKIPNEYLTLETDLKLKILKETASDLSATANQVVLAWMMQGNPSIIPIVAISTEQQLDENLGALDLKLSRTQLDRLSTELPIDS